jgi:hypothetical protein
MQALAIGVIACERLELRGELRVPAHSQIGLDAVLDRLEPFLPEPVHLRPQRQCIREVRVRLAVPEGQGLVQ